LLIFSNQVQAVGYRIPYTVCLIKYFNWWFGGYCSLSANYMYTILIYTTTTG